LALLIAAVVVRLPFVYRNQRQQRIMMEIETFGGVAKPRPPAWKLLVHHVTGTPTDVGSIHLLGPVFDDEWLERRNCLRDFEFDVLVLGNTRISERGIDALVRGRKLKTFLISPPVGKYDSDGESLER